MADYKVQFVPDEVLDGRDFVMCNSEVGVALYMGRSVRSLPEADSEAVWEDAWAAYRELLARIDRIPVQRQRNLELAELLRATVAP